jgi:hypothetical protein
MKRAEPPLEFWVWLAVAGIILISVGASISFPSQIVQPPN